MGGMKSGSWGKRGKSVHSVAHSCLSLSLSGRFRGIRSSQLVEASEREGERDGGVNETNGGEVIHTVAPGRRDEETNKQNRVKAIIRTSLRSQTQKRTDVSFLLLLHLSERHTHTHSNMVPDSYPCKANDNSGGDLYETTAMVPPFIPTTVDNTRLQCHRFPHDMNDPRREELIAIGECLRSISHRFASRFSPSSRPAHNHALTTPSPVS